MKRILLGVLLIVGVSSSFGQKKQKITIPPLSDIKIDADLTEWDALVDVADEGLWFYQLAQDASNLYVAIRIEDAFLQSLAARNGILVGVLANIRNRDDIQFMFPYPDGEVKRAMLSEDHRSDTDFKKSLINRSRGYFVNGFPTVPNGLLSLQNSYGLHATARVDEGVLYYEAVVPKALLDYTTPVATLKLAVNDGITTLAPSNKRRTARVKHEHTMTVLLETTID